MLPFLFFRISTSTILLSNFIVVLNKNAFSDFVCTHSSPFKRRIMLLTRNILGRGPGISKGTLQRLRLGIQRRTISLSHQPANWQDMKLRWAKDGNNVPVSYHMGHREDPERYIIVFNEFSTIF